MAEIKRLLIANRGEIAVRIAATAQRMGIFTAAVYSDADRNALHVEACHAAFGLGGRQSAESYLDLDKILAAARKMQCDAIHPGYGFLSENPEFARRCDKAGIIFIGPTAHSIEIMGDKSTARSAAEAAGIPVVPGFANDGAIKVLLQHAEDIGYPVMLKATAGGGGKGMRVVEGAGDFADALASVCRESKAAFGDDQMLLEKYLPQARHIEVQVFGDQHGNHIHLFERDCSLQRRRQKIIEEAPAPNLDAATRQALCETAVLCARHIGYQGAGTVEFLLAPDNQFYFMEMNTRLQVEHRVTEMITGIDLVQWQIRIAQGEPLPLSQDEIQCSGHGFEARIYAENPENNFLPTTGTIGYLEMPVQSQQVIADWGVRQGDTIDVYYDPMLAKLITHDKNREAACRRMVDVLNSTTLLGLTTNLGFLGQLMNDRRVIEGHTTTRCLEESPPRSFPDCRSVSAEQALAAGVVHTLAEQRKESRQCNQPWATLRRWHNGTPRNGIIRVNIRGSAGTLCVTESANGYIVCDVSAGNHSEVRIIESSENCTLLRVDGKVCSTVSHCQGALQHMKIDNVYRWIEYVDPLKEKYADKPNDASLYAPMPGSVVAVNVDVDDEIASDETLMIIEAMKMEHRIRAPQSGRVKAIHFSVGDKVNEGEQLISLY